MADEQCEGCPVVNATSFYTAMSMKAAMENDALRASNATANAQANNIIQTQGLQLSQKTAYEIGLQEARAGSHVISADETSSRVTSSALAIAAAQALAKLAQTVPPVTP